MLKSNLVYKDSFYNYPIHGVDETKLQGVFEKHWVRNILLSACKLTILSSTCCSSLVRAGLGEQVNGSCKWFAIVLIVAGKSHLMGG